MSVSLDSDVMREVVAKAIIDQIGPEQREKLVRDAVTGVLNAGGGRDGYGRKAATPLQLAFDEAVRDCAMKFAGKIMREDESLKALVDGLLREMIQRTIVERREEIIKAFGDMVDRAMRSMWEKVY